MTELWDVYTKGREKAGRTHARGLPLAAGDFHIVVVVWIVTPDGRILLTKRHPDKPVWPEYWECTGGSVLAGEDSAQGALREAEEEIGIVLDPGKGRMLRSYASQDSIYDYWVFIQDLDLAKTKLQAEEVVDIKFVSREELQAMFDAKLIIPTLGGFLELIESDELLSKILG
jgi:8-oxo-dGTP diphosphatase